MALTCLRNLFLTGAEPIRFGVIISMRPNCRWRGAYNIVSGFFLNATFAQAKTASSSFLLNWESFFGETFILKSNFFSVRPELVEGRERFLS